MMDTEEHRKISTTPGNEGHEVHFCNKCGWPFPNPHPSAKHRRAHKKVCGTVEGYKLVGSEERTPHLTVSDGEQHSDEDLKTPSPKPLERSDNEKGSGVSVGLGERSNRSEEEVFSDAVAEFIDSGSSHGTEEQVEDIKEPAIQVQTISDGCAQTGQLNEDHAVGDINTPLTMSAERSHIQSTEVQGCNLSESAQGVLGYTSDIDLTEIASVDGLTGKSAVGTSPLKLEAQPDALLESKEENAGKALADSVGQVNEGSNLDRQVSVVALPVVHVNKKDEVVCELGKSDDITPGPVLVKGVVQSNEGDTVGIAQKLDMDGSGNSTEDHDGNVVEEVMHVVSVPDESPAVDNAETLIKGFKDHERRNLPGFVDADSFEIVNVVQDSVPEDNSSSSLPRPLEEGAMVSALDTDVLHANDKLKGESNELVFEQFTGEAESAALQSNNYTVNSDKISEESIACENNGVTEMEKIYNVVSPQYSTVISDVDPVVVPTGGEVGQTTSGKDDADDGISRNYDEQTTEKCYSEDIISHSEPATVHSLMPTGTDVLGVECAADSEVKIKRSEQSGSETGKDGSASVMMDASTSKKSKTSSESASELYVSSQTVIGSSEDKFSEPEYTSADIISDTKEGLKEHESCDNDKVHIEHVGAVSVASQSIDGAVELIQQPNNNEMTSKPVISPPDISSSLLNAAAFEDDHCKNLVGIASRSAAKSLLNENDQNVVIQQVGASAADLTVDSSSQTDSMEGQCGSISVHSTQSEYPAFAASETTETANGCQETAETSEKVSPNKPQSLSATQHSDKSDLFEPPSFMTLVEPRGVGGQNTAASQVQMVENQQAVSSDRAGWFPSGNHVVNETLGRKKNEEIIAKVTNWSTGKQHIPIKSLLGEATIETKPKSPNAKENSSSMVQKDESIETDRDAVTSTTTSGPGPQAAAKKEEGKEWNSPARYPAEVKREKRKVKGRPYWAQFVCCSSVN